MTRRFGRIIAVAMVLCLFVTSVPIMTVKAEDSTVSNNSTNVIVNGSFENVSEESQGWTTMIDNSNSKDSITFDETTGAALFIGTVGASKLALTQEIGVSVGDTNVFAGKVKITEGTPAVFMTVTYYGTDNTQIGSIQNVDCSGVNQGTEDFTEVNNGVGCIVPEGAAKAKISIGMIGVGKCLWDDVKFLVKQNITDSTIHATLVNGSFETLHTDTGMPANWTVTVADSTSGDGVTVQENSKVLWQTLLTSGSFRNYRTDSLTVENRQTYKLTGKLKVMSESVRCSVDMRNSDGNKVSNGPYLTGNGITIGEWHDFEVDLTINKETNNAQLALWREKATDGSYTGMCYWDDISLQLVNGTGTNLINNGDFEEVTIDAVSGIEVLNGWKSNSSAFSNGTYFGVTDTIIDDPATEAVEIYAPLFTGTNTNSDVSLTSEKVSVTAGAAVHFSAALQVYEDIATAAPYITVSYYDVNGNKLDTTHTAECDGKKIGEWVTVNSAEELIVPTGAVSATITVGQKNVGKCMWDAVTFSAVGGDAFTDKLTNGSFATDLSGWTMSVAEVEQDSVQFTNEENCVADGTYSAVFNGTQPSSDVALIQDISVTGGEIYSLSAWTKIYAGTATPYLTITYKDVNGAEIADSKVEKTLSAQFMTDCGWTEISENVIVPVSAKSAKIKIGQSGIGKCLWDDVKLSTLVTQLNNGSFENMKNGMPVDWRVSADVDGDSLAVQDHGIVLMLKREKDKQGNSSPAVDQVISNLTGSVLDGTSITEKVTYTLKADVMYMINEINPAKDYEAKPVLDINGNGLREGTDAAGTPYRMSMYCRNDYEMVPGKWQEVTYTYTAPSDLNNMLLRLINQGDGHVYYDNVMLYKTDDPTQTNLITNWNFEEGMEDWNIKEPNDARYSINVHYGTVKTASKGMNAAWFEGTAEGSEVSYEQTVALDTTASKYTYYANVKISAVSEGSPYLKVTHYNANGEVVGTQSADCSEIVTGIWNTVTLSYDVPEGAVAATISMGQSGIGTCQWDNVQFLPGEVIIPDEKDSADLAAEFRVMLAREEATATEEIVEPWGEVNTYELPHPGQSNVLLNGDFELNNGTDTSVLEHFTLKESWQKYASVGVGEGADGKDCIKFNVPEADGQQNPYYEQYITLVGGAEYQVSYKYKVVCEGEDRYASPTVKLEYFSDLDLPGVVRLGERYVHPDTNTLMADGEWHTYTQKVYPDTNVFDVKVMVRSLAAGVNMDDSTTVYIDDVEIFMTRPPKSLVLKTDSIFYYSDVVAAEGATGTITTSIDTGYFPEFQNAKIDLEMKGPDGQTVWPSDGESKTYTSVDGVVTASFPVSLLAKKEQRYEVVATLYNTDGSINQRNVQNIFVYDRPTSLSADGVYTLDNGEVFYPEYAYHCTINESENFTKLNGSGINLIQMTKGPDLELAKQYLDAMHAQGAMAIVCLYRNMKPAGDSSNIEITINTIEALKDHPAVFGYGVMDEVFLHLTDPQDVMEDSYRLIRSLDPTHPIMTMEAESYFYEECGKYVDILCIDPYASAASQSVAKKTMTAVEGVDNKKPVYALLEAYRNTHGNYPTPNDLRNNIYQALIKDADAVGYFSITDSEIDDTTGKNDVPIWDAKDGGALWQAIKDFNAYEKQIVYDHFVFDKSEVYTESANVGDAYWYSSWKVEDGNYYMAVLSMLEDAEATQEVTIPLHKEGDEAFGRFNATAINGRIDANGAGEVVVGKDSLELTLQGCEAVLFKIESADVLDVFEDNDCASDSYRIGTEATVTFKVDTTGVIGIEVNGTVLDNANYSVNDETGEIVLNNAYLETLPVGEHIVTLIYTEGYAETTLEIVEALEIVSDKSDSTYKLGVTGDTVQIYCNGELDKFVSVEVNGTVVADDNYTLTEGSTVLTFKAAYLESLTAGNYTVKMNYTDGSIETTLAISTKDTDADISRNTDEESSISVDTSINVGSSSNDTGDHSNVMFWLLMVAVTIVIGTFAIIYNTKSQK